MHFYSDPEREKETYALPDCEVFYADRGEWAYDLRSGERCDFDWCDHCEGNGCDECQGNGYPVTIEPCEAGYYFWFCFPGCLPDSEPFGPYETEEEAIAAARDQ